jgi:hypothetical protein
MLNMVDCSASTRASNCVLGTLLISSVCNMPRGVYYVQQQVEGTSAP